MKNLSIIIPFRGSIATLPRLFATIPEDKSIEIILVENSDTPRSKEDIRISRDYKLLNSDANKYAGGARNVGIEASSGKWIVFADADDYFAPNAFKIFEKYLDSPYDLIYFGCNSVYEDTLEQAKRHIWYNNLIIDVTNGIISESKVKADHDVPWAKMLRREFVIKKNLKYKEIKACEDVIFAIKSGIESALTYYDRESVYIITDQEGSLSKLCNDEIIKAKIETIISKNELLQKHTLNKYRTSILATLYRLLKQFPNEKKTIIKSFINYKSYLFKDAVNLYREIQRRLMPF